MTINVEAASQIQTIEFNAPQQIETLSLEKVIHVNEQIAELLENPFMKKEVMDRNQEKINDALKVLNAIYSSDFLNDANEEELYNLAQHFDKAKKLLGSAIDSNGKLIAGFSLNEIDKNSLNQLMLDELNKMSFQEKQLFAAINMGLGIAPGPVGGSGVTGDMEIVDKLNTFVANLTEIYLKRYQEAADASTKVYTAFAEINITISEMISKATVDADKNTIQLDVKGLRDAINALEEKLFVSGEIVDQLKAITFPADMEAMAKELVQGSGLVLVAMMPAGTGFHLAVDRSAFDNLKEAFNALSDKMNLVDPANINVIKVPSGTLQAFQTAVESVNNRVSTNNQTLIERLRTATSQQQQTVQLFSSLLKEIIESNKGFITKIT